jgi:RNA polymerase sigma factor (TIGR02999 family)
MLQAAREGDQEALDRVVTTMYQELRRLAAAYMARERSDHTLQPTALLNEACLRLLGKGVSWKDRQHFTACAAQQMRRILVDHARGRNAQKRGGEEIFRVTAEPAAPVALTSIDLLALDEALEVLMKLDPRQGRIVELRYFGGFSEEEIAQVLNIAVRTVRRDWAHAKATLARHLGIGRVSHAARS